MRRPRVAVSVGTIKAEASSVTVHTTSHEFPIITGPPLPPYRHQTILDGEYAKIGHFKICKWSKNSPDYFNLIILLACDER